MSVNKSTNVRISQRAHMLRMGAMATAVRADTPLAPRLAAELAADVFFATPPPRPTTSAEARVLARARRSELVHDGERLATWRWGAGAVVVLMHGWGGSAAQLTPLVDPLLEAGLEVIAIDAPGHGESTGRQASIPRFAGVIDRVVREVGSAYGVIAHSMGGAAASLALARGLDVERAAFVGPPSDAMRWFRTFERAIRLDPKVSRETLRVIERRAGVSVEALRAEVLGPAVRVPLLVVHDRDDREVPLAEGEEVARSTPGAQLRVTSGLGHRRILADAQVIRDVVDFVAARPLSMASTVLSAGAAAA